MTTLEEVCRALSKLRCPPLRDEYDLHGLAAEALQTDVLCYGISYMYQKWTLGQYPLSADEAADALFAIMPESLRDDWFLEGREDA